jgi:hypothetical protein
MSAKAAETPRPQVVVTPSAQLPEECPAAAPSSHHESPEETGAVRRLRKTRTLAERPSETARVKAGVERTIAGRRAERLKRLVDVSYVLWDVVVRRLVMDEDERGRTSRREHAMMLWDGVGVFLMPVRSLWLLVDSSLPDMGPPALRRIATGASIPALESALRTFSETVNHSQALEAAIEGLCHGRRYGHKEIMAFVRRHRSYADMYRVMNARGIMKECVLGDRIALAADISNSPWFRRKRPPPPDDAPGVGGCPVHSNRKKRPMPPSADDRRSRGSGTWAYYDSKLSSTFAKQLCAHGSVIMADMMRDEIDLFPHDSECWKALLQHACRSGRTAVFDSLGDYCELDRSTIDSKRAGVDAVKWCSSSKYPHAVRVLEWLREKFGVASHAEYRRWSVEYVVLRDASAVGPELEVVEVVVSARYGRPAVYDYGSPG